MSYKFRKSKLVHCLEK